MPNTLTDEEIEKVAERYKDAWDHCDPGVSLSYEQVAGLLETIQAQREALEAVGRELQNGHYVTAEVIMQVHSVLGWQDDAPQEGS